MSFRSTLYSSCMVNNAVSAANCIPIAIYPKSDRCYEYSNRFTVAGFLVLNEGMQYL
jgi:hypothetical protein